MEYLSFARELAGVAGGLAGWEGGGPGGRERSGNGGSTLGSAHGAGMSTIRRMRQTSLQRDRVDDLDGFLISMDYGLFTEILQNAFPPGSCSASEYEMKLTNRTQFRFL